MFSLSSTSEVSGAVRGRRGEGGEGREEMGREERGRRRGEGGEGKEEREGGEGRMVEGGMM